ncbi:MAG: hypothetical protein EON98_13295 [Chitinophagaceae bacterium]|nr:MAG: hypothetical protein EON98_13295 [Chitinophagaceae bacterium]
MYTQNISHKEALGGRLDEGYSVGKYQNKEYNYEFLGQYTKQFNDLSMNINVGANKYTRNFSSVSGSTVGGLLSPAFYSLAGSVARPNISSNIINKEIRSVYGMASFGYKDIYFIDASVRNDVSSALPQKNNSYQKNENQIIDLSVSGASGVSLAVVNAGLIENKGIEISLNARPVQSSFFSWNTTLNFARNRNMVKELYPGVNTYQLDVNTYSSVSIFLNAEVNKPFGSLVGQAYLRDPKSGKIMLDASNLPLFEANHNFGSVLPEFTGGFLNNFKIWKFDLNAMIDFQKGGQFFSWSKMLAVKSGQAAETAVLNDKGANVRDALASGGGVKVTGINPSGQEVTAYVDARSYFRNTIGTRIYEEWLYDASYIKLREVSLGYSFDKNLVAKTPFKSVKLSVIARNPAMLWQKAPKGLEPSELSYGSGSISWLEKGEFQTVRSYGINLNLGF